MDKNILKHDQGKNVENYKKNNCCFSNNPKQWMEGLSIENCICDLYN